MRIENQGSQGISNSGRASSTRSIGPEATTGHMTPAQSGTDQVSLSNASSLLSLAKNLPSAKQTKIEALTSLYNAGNYVPDAAATSRGLLDSMKKQTFVG